jgi:hypothetical protein
MDPLRPGDPQHIGDYVLSGRLGSGGMGQVFFGRSRSGRAVAIKLIQPLFASEMEFRTRFRREVEALEKVGGHYTAGVIDSNTNADVPWMATAYVQGPSLNQVLERYYSLPLYTVQVLGAGLAEALVKIHAAGIIHRDLKPSNILLASDGPRVIDFGIARAMDVSGLTVRPGTPGFIAPEVLANKPITRACDIFAFGVVLAFAAGIRPFGEADESVDRKIMHEEPDLRGLDSQIRGLVEQCLSKDPAERPTAEELLRRLAQPDPGAPWLPEEVYEMIDACAPPRESAVPDIKALDHPRLLAEAEQIARALPNEYERAVAMLHAATAACRIDPDHAARLLSEAWYPARHTGEMDDQRHRDLVEYLIGSAPVEVGTVLGWADPVLADQVLTDVVEYSRHLSHRNMGAEESSAQVIIKIAESAAAQPDRADRLARVLTDESLQATAIARVAMMLAYTQPARASEMIRTVIARMEPVPRPAAGRAGEGWPSSRWRRSRARPPEPAAAPLDDNVARYWAVRALTEVALAVSGARPIWTNQLSTDGGEFARTITVDNRPGDRAPNPASQQARFNRAQAQTYLADAERLASRIANPGFTTGNVSAADLRAAALCAVKAAAARVDRRNAAAVLAEAEQTAHAISADWPRFEALVQVALTASHTDPMRTERIARALIRLPHKLGELAMVTARSDMAHAKRIAATIADPYLRALTEAVLDVKTAPDLAEPLLSEALREARAHPGRVAEVAAVIARTDPARAEEIARTLAVGPEIRYVPSDDGQVEQHAINGWVRSAEFWRSWALADLAVVSYETRSGAAASTRTTLQK